MAEYRLSSAWDISPIEAARTRAVSAIRDVGKEADKVERQMKGDGARASEKYASALQKAERESKQLREQTRKLERRLERLERQKKKNERAAGGLTRSFKAMRAGVVGLAAFFVASGASSLVRGVVDTGVAFEKLQAQLLTVTGSQGAAEEAFSGILEFATKTPFQVDSITESFIRLKAVGVEPTLELLTAAGDTAAANGRDILQFSEAIVGAVTGEMERLKQFGIVARQQNDEVTFLFKGTETKVKKNATEIVNALLSIGQTSFAGGMARQAATVGGAFSNLGDATAALKSEIFKSGLGEAIGGITRALTENVSAITEWLKRENDLEAALDRLAPKAQAAAGRVRNLVDEIDRAPEVQGALDAYRGLSEMLAEAEAAFEAADAAADNTTAYIKAESRVNRLRIALEKAAQELFGLRSENKDTEESQEDAGEAAEEHRKRLSELEDALKDASKDRSYLQRMEEIEEQHRANIAAIEEEVELLKQLAELNNASPLSFGASDIGGIPSALPEEGDFAFEGAVESLERINQLEREAQDEQSELNAAYEDAVGWLEQQDSLWLRIEGSLGRVSGIAGILTQAFSGMGNEIGDLLAGLARGVQTFAEVAAQTDSILAGVLSGLQATGIDFGDTGNSVLSGAAGGASIGAQVGPAGAAWGAAIGGAVGFVADLLSKTAQGFVDGAAHADGIRSNLAEGKLSSEVQRLASVIETEFNSILEATGGVVSNFTTFGVLLREDSKGLRVAIDGIWTDFGDDAQAAIDFAVTELVRRSNIQGASPLVTAALERFGDGTLEELRTGVALALDVEKLGIPEAARRFSAEIDRYMDMLRSLPEGAAQILGQHGAGGAFESEFNRLFGIQQDAGELRRAEIQAYEAQIEVRIAELRAMGAELEARQATAQARITDTRILVDAADGASRGLLAFSGAIAGTGEVAAQTAAGMAEASAAIAGAISALEGIQGRITPQSIEEAIRRARRSASGGGRSSVAAPDNTASLRERLELMEAEGDQAALNAIEIRNLLEEMERSKLSEKERGRLIELTVEAQQRAAQELRDNVLEPFRQAAGPQGLTGQLISLREAANEAAEAIDAGAGSVEDLIIREGEAAQARELGASALSSLGSRMLATRNEIEGTAATVAFLRDNAAELGLSLSDLAIAMEEISGREFGAIGGFLADALGDEETLAEIRRESFLFELDVMRTRFELLVAENQLSEEHAERLRELFEQVDDRLDSILSGIGSPSSPGAPRPTSTSTAPGQSEAERLLAQLADLLNPTAGDPIAAVNRQAEELLESFQGVAGFLAQFGTSLGEVTQQIEQWRLEEISRVTEQASQGLLSFYESLTGGPLSGGTALEQAQSAYARVTNLIARAQGGDLSARDELAREGEALLNLVSRSFGSASVGGLRAQLISAVGGILGFGPADGGGGSLPTNLPGGGTGGTQDYRPAENDMIRLLEQILGALDFQTRDRQLGDQERSREMAELTQAVRESTAARFDQQGPAGLVGATKRLRAA